MSTNSSGIVFSGLGSGIDTNSIVNQLMSLERRPITALNTQKARLDTTQSVESGLQGLFNALRDKANALKDASVFNVNGVTVKDATLMSATAQASAPAGTYSVTVTQLAKAQTLEASSSPALVSDTLHITSGGTTIDVAVNDGESLSDLAARINATEDAPVSASVINSRLVLFARSEGSASAISVTSDGATAASFGFVERQPAQDAIVSINGVSVTASGNTIDSAIEGLSLTLAKEGTTTVTIARDADAVLKSVQGFVDAYNAAVGNVQTALRYDAATKQAGALQGDQSYQTVVSQLRSNAGSAVTGLSGAYSSLASLGITSDRSGQLSIDSAKFKAALSADPTAVAKVFGADAGATTKTLADGVATRLADLASNIASDVIGKRLSGYTTQKARIDQRIADLEQVMTLRESRLRQRFSAMESQVARFSSIGSQIATKLG